MIGTHACWCRSGQLRTAGTSSWGWSDPPRWRWAWPRTPWRQRATQSGAGACREISSNSSCLKWHVEHTQCPSLIHSFIHTSTHLQTVLHVHVTYSVWTPGFIVLYNQWNVSFKYYTKYKTIINDQQCPWCIRGNVTNRLRGRNTGLYNALHPIYTEIYQNMF